MAYGTSWACGTSWVCGTSWACGTTSVSSGASRRCSGAARTWASSEVPSSHGAERGRIDVWAPRSGDSSDLSDT